MKWLKKRYRNEVGEIDARVVKLLLGVRKWLNRFAECLQRKMNHFSVRKQKIALAFYCLSFTSASLYVAVASFNRRSYGYNQQSISITPLLKQQDVHAQISFQELTRIHQFKVHIDSLSGEERRQFLAGRPHLMDTVNFLESLYQKEINTK
jgi:hypothetical protein